MGNSPNYGLIEQVTIAWIVHYNKHQTKHIVAEFKGGPSHETCLAHGPSLSKDLVVMRDIVSALTSIRNVRLVAGDKHSNNSSS